MSAGWLAALFWCSVLRVCVSFDKNTCPHCPTEESYREFLKDPSADHGPHTDIFMYWSTHIEVIPITTDIGGWEPPSFHEKLAKEAIRGWTQFRDDIGPGLQRGHPLRNFLSQSHAGALNDGFFHWQKRLFEAEGDYDKSLAMNPDSPPTPPPDANCSWPEMNASPEFQRLRQYVEYFSRRYLERSGMSNQMAQGLNYSLFNWCAVHGPGEFHGPHTHVGEYHVGVFYAQNGPAGGKLRFGDPRGQNPPFGRHYLHTPRAGDLYLFPSWLSHAATVTSPSTDILNHGEAPYRVTFPFNIGPVQGPLPCHLWWSDPTSDMKFFRRSKVDVQAALSAKIGKNMPGQKRPGQR